MSMKDNPCSGYVLEAEKLLTVFDPTDRDTAQWLIEEGDHEGFQELLENKFPKTFALPAETFIFSDEDTSEEMEAGKMYCRWDESDLYQKLERTELLFLKRAIGTTPQMANWTIWG
ncbi:MAG: hypothetical protein M0R80_23545 [Proteobacteria bacterium]|jgi:hypothetical protein|nr:hypothetical protein [Pseudomonadota bacterium]